MRHLGPTLSFPEDAEVLTRFGGYASVLKLTDDLAIAISTDGVGSKTIIATLLDRYDTIGFDCVAMNANDIICVGARPIAMVDYLGVHSLDPRRADEILAGLGDAAKEAGIAIPGGELAQLPEVIGPGEKDFDLVGTCIGTVHPDRVVTGTKVEPGDVLIGIASTGIHSNGLTLARRVLLTDGRSTSARSSRCGTRGSSRTASCTSRATASRTCAGSRPPWVIGSNRSPRALVSSI
jgi:phosphoribosylformylglycinamidine cyclo-ligase